MKSAAVLIVFAASSMIAFAADQPQATGVVHFDHAKVSAAFASGGPLLSTNNFKIQAGRRTTPGEVEIHDRDTDVFYVLEGSATFVTGGKAVEPKTVLPGEIRASALLFVVKARRGCE